MKVANAMTRDLSIATDIQCPWEGGGPADLNGAANKIARDLPSDCSSSHPIQTRSRQLTPHADTGVWYLGQYCVAQVNRKQGGVNPLTQKCYLIAG